MLSADSSWLELLEPDLGLVLSIMAVLGTYSQAGVVGDCLIRKLPLVKALYYDEYDNRSVAQVRLAVGRSNRIS